MKRKTEIGDGEASMVTLKAMLQEITKSKRYDGIEALGYYERLTKVKWKSESLVLYEESLLKDDFITHNTVLSIFTDADNQVEKKIKKEKTMKTKKSDKVVKQTKLSELSKKELQKEATRLGLNFKTKATKETLIKIIEDAAFENVPTVLAKNKDAEKVVKTEKLKISGIGIPTQTNATPVVVTTLMEFVSMNPNLSYGDILEGTCRLCKILKGGGYGGKLLSELDSIMKKDLETWILTHTIEADEQNRKYIYIKKLKPKGESKPKGEKLKTQVVSSEIINDLSSVVLTEKILSDLDWVTLKKLSKSRGFNSFGKSKQTIIDGILNTGKKTSKKEKSKKEKSKKEKSKKEKRVEKVRKEQDKRDGFTKVIKGLSELKNTITQ